MALTYFYFLAVGSFACQVSFIKVKTGEKWRVYTGGEPDPKKKEK